MKAITIVPLAVTLTAIALIASMQGRLGHRTSAASLEQQRVQDLAAPRVQAPQVQLFVGRIVKTGENYILWDNASATTYKLDNQQEARRFNGQKVKIEGKLDTSSNTIQVSSIEPDA